MHKGESPFPFPVCKEKTNKESATEVGFNMVK